MSQASMRHAFSAPAASPLTNDKRSVVLYMQGSTRFSPSWAFEEVKDEQTGAINTVLRVRDMPVFRSGSFKDSMGDLTTWETLHIEQMVSSFGFLRENSVFPDVPVREGHGSFFGDPMTGLVGYHDALRSQDAIADDGNTYRYLLADFTIYDQAHQNAFLAGKWKNRSSEVGYYESNDGTGYYPVYQGFAFVDIPAVQYLNQFGKEKQRSFTVLLEKEIPVADAPVIPETPTVVEPNGSAAPEGQQADNADESGAGGAGEGQPEPVAVVPPTPVPPATPAPAGQHAQGGAQPHAFQCGGNAVSDFAAVQSYITGLETEANSLREFRAEQVTAGRTAFINGLVSGNKMTAAQGAFYLEDVLTMDNDRFGKFKQMWDAAPVAPIFASHVGGQGGTPEAVNAEQKDLSDYSTAAMKIAWHRSTGQLSEDQIKETPSWAEYQRLGQKLGKDIS